MEINIIFPGMNGLIGNISNNKIDIFRTRISNDFRDLLKYQGDIKIALKNDITGKTRHYFLKVASYSDLAPPEQTIRLLKKRAVSSLQSLLDQSIINVGENEVEIIFDKTPQINEPFEKKGQAGMEQSQENELDFQQRARQYAAKDPMWSFESLILPQIVIEEIILALKTIEFEPKIFDEWGLRAFEPFPRSALNFYGPPGTGKTMAAHAIAHKLGKKILIASYAQIESKYHGEGPKNVEAIFLAAQRDDAVLFIDEADSLLSKRLINVTQGTEQAINSMRSQLLICLEKFRGIIIFATNLVKNYDFAFETRVKNIHFSLPDKECRKKIWEVHLVAKIPKGPDLDTEELAEKYPDLCGRDIKNAVIDACVSIVFKQKEVLEQADLLHSCQKIIETRGKLSDAKDDTIDHKNDLKNDQAFKGIIKAQVEAASALQKTEETQSA